MNSAADTILVLILGMCMGVGGLIFAILLYQYAFTTGKTEGAVEQIRKQREQQDPVGIIHQLVEIDHQWVDITVDINRVTHPTVTTLTRTRRKVYG
jgi:hypothetical protein